MCCFVLFDCDCVVECVVVFGVCDVVVEYVFVWQQMCVECDFQCVGQQQVGCGEVVVDELVVVGECLCECVLYVCDVVLVECDWIVGCVGEFFGYCWFEIGWCEEYLLKEMVVQWIVGCDVEFGVGVMVGKIEQYGV